MNCQTCGAQKIAAWEKICPNCGAELQAGGYPEDDPSGYPEYYYDDIEDNFDRFDEEHEIQKAERDYEKHLDRMGEHGT